MRRLAILCLGLLLISWISLAQAQAPGDCQPWSQVNDDAFGLDDPSGQSPPYQSEDTFEVTVFQGQLYLGMEADDDYGARVWRTKDGVAIAGDQGDWEQVVDDAFGDANNNDHIDSLQAFDGYLYASTGQKNASRDGTEVWRSPSGDAGTWVQVNDDGFGDPANENFWDMAVFAVGGTPWLCGGTLNYTLGTQLWCTDGSLSGGGPQLEWVQKNKDGFGQAQHVKVWGTEVLDGYLYASTYCYDGAICPGAVWRTDGTAEGARWQWTQVFTATDDSRVHLVGVHEGHLYASFAGSAGIEVWRSSTGAAGSWSQVNANGFGDANNGLGIADTGAVYNGALYLATGNGATGSEVWRTADGLAWTQVNADGFGHADTATASLIPFNGYLYAWAGNYATGQKVLRTKCPLCQSRAIAGAGSYTFEGVGATLDVAEESLDSIEICVYPGAFPTDGGPNRLVKRHYEIRPTPSDGAFTADVTLSYTDDEFDASDIADENTTALARWTGSAWADCPLGDRAREPAENTATCRAVTAFSTWVITGSSHLQYLPIVHASSAATSTRAIAGDFPPPAYLNNTFPTAVTPGPLQADSSSQRSRPSPWAWRQTRRSPHPR